MSTQLLEPDVRLASEIGVDIPDADDSELPENLQIALEVERQLLVHYKAGIERYKTFCHMTYRRMDVLRDKLNQIDIARLEKEGVPMN